LGLPLPFSGGGGLLRLCLKLYFHAAKQKSTDKSRLAHHLIRRDSRALENVVQKPRSAASNYQFFTVSL
jgi:hypothetical protein